MREKIKLVSSAGTGHYYTTDKNKRNTPDKMEMKKYDPVVRKHVMYRRARSSKVGIPRNPLRRVFLCLLSGTASEQQVLSTMPGRRSARFRTRYKHVHVRSAPAFLAGDGLGDPWQSGASPANRHLNDNHTHA